MRTAMRRGVVALLLSSLESAWVAGTPEAGAGAFRLPSAIVGIEASVEQMEKLYLKQGAYKEAAKYEKLRKQLDQLRLVPSSDAAVKGRLENDVASQLINLQRELIVDHATVQAVRKQNKHQKRAFVKLAEQTEKVSQTNWTIDRIYNGLFYVVWAAGLMSIGMSMVLAGDSIVQRWQRGVEVSILYSCDLLLIQRYSVLSRLWMEKQVVYWGTLQLCPMD
jgi:hypothetical protein